MLAISSPSGAGKTTISRRLLEEEDSMQMSVSVTTRPPRPGEQHGVDYFFLGQEEYDRMVKEHEFLEHARVYDNCYGTPRKAVEACLASGQDVLFDIDWQGTQQIAEAARSDLASVFVLPPSLGELERRLRGRGTDSEEIIARRMARAVDEMSHWPEYDYIIVNDDLEDSIAKVRAILTAERQRRYRQQGVAEFIVCLREEDALEHQGG